jgi:hypothetical protein
MSFYEDSEKWEERGIDSDFYNCHYHNIGEGEFKMDDVEKVIAVVEGEHDGAAYHWIARLTGDRYVYMTGGCDYTGWD